MAPYDDTAGPNRFDSFHVYTASYKKIGEHEIQVGIIVPKGVVFGEGKNPLFVKFHGGGLVSGTWDYPNWFAKWLVPLVHRNNAIGVLPNYRLLPEHNGEDIREDLADFWTWFHNGGVKAHLVTQNSEYQNLDLDFDHLLAGGDSAGGYMAIMSGLTQPKGTIKAVLAQYPMTNYLNREPQEDFMGAPSPGPEVIDEHVRGIKPGTVISGARPPHRQNLSYALSAYKRYNEVFGTGSHLWPISLIENSSHFPPALILHGNKDTAVSIEDSRAFVQRAREVLGEGADINLVVRDGEDHGFDIDMSESKEEWLKEAVAWLEGKWKP